RRAFLRSLPHSAGLRPARRPQNWFFSLHSPFVSSGPPRPGQRSAHLSTESALLEHPPVCRWVSEMALSKTCESEETFQISHVRFHSLAINRNWMGPYGLHGDRALKEKNWVEDVLAFWFGELKPEDWFEQKDATDNAIRTRFAKLQASLFEQAPFVSFD